MSGRQLERLAGELRRWAERPGSISPAAARTRVLARLPGDGRRPSRRLVTGGVALAATALAVVLLVDGRRETVEAPAPVVAKAPRTIVHQLSTGTRLYIVVRPETGRAGADGER